MRVVSQETKEKLRISALKRGVKPPSRKGSTHTLEARKKMSASRTKHGKSPLVHRLRNSYEMKQWRKAVFDRDDYTCQMCHNKSCKGNYVYIQADHHPVLFSAIIREENINTLDDARKSKKLWDINNGRTLCLACHREETRKLYK
jgi:5-methylcytosine-specific restriction endonuclease McrA